MSPGTHDRERLPQGNSGMSDAELVLSLMGVKDQTATEEEERKGGSDSPAGSPFSWSDLVQLGEEALLRERPYVKLRVSRGLRALQKTGKVEKIGKLYRLAREAKGGPTQAYLGLELLGESIDLMKQALASLDDESRRGLVGATWDFLRDRFKDAALAVELELRRAKIPIEHSLSVRHIEGPDGKPANRRVLVQFEAASIEGWDWIDKRNALAALQRGFFRPPLSPQAAPGGRPSPRSGGRRTPSRPRAGRGPRGRRPPSPPSSRPR